MTDREKVIESLKACAVDRYKAEYCLTCPYDFCGHDEDTGLCVDRLMADALELLKQYEESWKRVKYSVIDAQMNNAGKNGNKDVYWILKFVTNLMDLQEKRWKDD